MTTQLLERERELADLDELAGLAASGTGCFAAIEAAAGLGKTRLLHAARDAGRRAGMQVLAARATELERDFPFALARQLFEPRLAGLQDVDREALLDGAAGAARGALGLDGGAPAVDTFAVLHGLYWLTAALAEQQPLLLAIDDAHWADAASLDYVGFLLPRLEELPVLLVVSSRPDEAGAESSVARIVTDGLARRPTPRPLSPAAAATLIAAELEQEPERAFAAACHEVSGGNLFLLRELARTIAAQAIGPRDAQAPRVHELAPERVTRTVLVRLARLSPAARAVAHAVVVLGDDADRTLVAELSGLSPAAATAAADELRGAAILDPDPSLRFVHPLVRTALNADLPAGERSAAHARAAELLQARGASAQQLATHLVATEARGERATVELLLEAGRQALASGAPRSAIACLTRALREPAPDDLRPAILHRLVGAGMRAPDRKLYAAVMPEVRSELARHPGLCVRWGLDVSRWMSFHGDIDDAAALLERAVAVAFERDEVDDAFCLEAQLGTLAQRPLAVNRDRLGPHVSRLASDSPTGRLAAALESQWHASDGTRADAVAAAHRALARNGLIFAEQREFLAPGRPVITLILADDLDAAQRAVDRALAIARERNATTELFAACWMAGGVAAARGDPAAAEADVRQALALVRLGLLPLELPLRAVLIGLLVARGELDAAEAELAAGGMAGELPEILSLSLSLWARGLLRHEQGRHPEAVDDLLKAERLVSRWGVIGMPGPPAPICAARALAALGDRERARAMAEAAMAHAQRWGAPTLRSHALRTVAMTQDGTKRIATLEQAVAVLAGTQTRLARAEALAELGAALRSAGRPADARAPLREGLELARRCGAAGLAKHASDELAATGEKVRRWTPIGVESLTPSERRVAEMAAGGLTNRQIAQTLFLTVKTIETHLAAVYDKLGIRSRRELPEALHQPSERALSPVR